ncbi:hypothetical protein QJS10_CPA16g00489 [Acorus calamus]|uniref:DUF4283 domain-containing protein n=1 Tax=Acorus calamus TaxID=4465 RepID=A0AAV9D3T0_ACOCL|nr:hypothetical protein QJS10_CPA16g00489 [Acorus calamus]
MIAVLEGGPWSMSSRPFIIQKLSPYTKLEQAKLTSIPIWMKFPYPPLHLCSTSVIGKVASFIGTPLFLDTATRMMTRISNARIYVEVQVGDPMPDWVCVRSNGEKEHLQVLYDWKPTACSVCDTFGHDDAMCGKQKPLVPPSKQLQSNVETSSKYIVAQKDATAQTANAPKSALDSQGIEQPVHVSNQKDDESGNPSTHSSNHTPTIVRISTNEKTIPSSPTGGATKQENVNPPNDQRKQAQIPILTNKSANSEQPQKKSHPLIRWILPTLLQKLVKMSTRWYYHLMQVALLSLK